MYLPETIEKNRERERRGEQRKEQAQNASSLTEAHRRSFFFHTKFLPVSFSH